jgi:hypothetical protein
MAYAVPSEALSFRCLLYVETYMRVAAGVVYTASLKVVVDTMNLTLLFALEMPYRNRSDRRHKTFRLEVRRAAMIETSKGQVERRLEIDSLESESTGEAHPVELHVEQSVQVRPELRSEVERVRYRRTPLLLASHFARVVNPPLLNLHAGLESGCQR